MNFQTLDRYLRAYTKYESIQRKTGTIYIEEESLFFKDLEKKRDKNNYKVPVIKDLLSQPKHFLLMKQDRFAPIPLHSHEWFEIQYAYSGGYDAIINGDEIHIHEGQILCLDTDVLHSIGYTGENDILINLLLEKNYFKKYLETHFSNSNDVTHFISTILSDRINHNRYLLIDESEALHFFFRYLMCHYYSPSINAELVCDNMISSILAEITAISEKEAFLGTSFHYDNTGLILQYISNNFRTCTQKSTAEFFAISPGYLTTLIKNQMGLTYKQLVQQIRLNYAENLLRNTDFPIDKICHDIGYENLSHFYKSFALKNGCTPNEFRIKYTATENT